MELRERRRLREEIALATRSGGFDVRKIPIRRCTASQINIESGLVIIFSNRIPGKESREAARAGPRRRENKDGRFRERHSRIHCGFNKIVVTVKPEKESASRSTQPRTSFTQALNGITSVSRSIVPS